MANWYDEIGKGLEIEAMKVAKESIDEVVEEFITFSAKVINSSPVGVQDSEGQYKGNWQVNDVENNTIMTKNPNANGLQIAKTGLLGKFKYGQDTSVYLFNNVPYANVIEYGGYIKTPTVGTWNKYLKKYEIRSSGGFSLQAPSGHVRIEVSKLNARLRSKFK